MLVGHPLNALEREIKRLLVREQLEKEQHKIIEEDEYSSKEVMCSVLSYLFYFVPRYDIKKRQQTFRIMCNDDELLDDNTQVNLYKL